MQINAFSNIVVPFNADELASARNKEYLGSKKVELIQESVSLSYTSFILSIRLYYRGADLMA